MVTPEPHFSDSILQTILTCHGFNDSYMIGTDDPSGVYDAELITHVNGVLADLSTRCGIGKVGYMVHSEENTWGEFLNETTEGSLLGMVMMYVYLRVRPTFDSDSMVGSILTEWKEATKQYEFSLMMAANTL